MIVGTIVSRLVNRLIHHAKVIAVVIVGVCAFAAYDQYDKRMNYIPVQARVTDVTEVCLLEKRRGRTRTSSVTMSCDRAEAAAQSDPKWQGFTVKYEITIAYDFVSPVDKKTYAGKHQYDAFPNGKRVTRGERIEVRASKTDPTKSREI